MSDVADVLVRLAHLADLERGLAAAATGAARVLHRYAADALALALRLELDGASAAERARYAAGLRDDVDPWPELPAALEAYAIETANHEGGAGCA